MVTRATQSVSIPISCKIRVLPSTEDTVKYAQKIETAGAAFITVHGRTREQKAHATGSADWDKIKAVKESVAVPVIANGNLNDMADVEACLRYSGCDAVMSAGG